jgi:hypothetical protein
MENTDNTVESQLKYTMSYGHSSNILNNKKINVKDGMFVVNAVYSPSVDHSEKFCDLTGDPNPIHRRHPEYGEALSPALLQNAVASVLVRELIKEAGKSALDHPFLLSKSYLKGPVITGFDYNIKAILNTTFEIFYSAYVEITNKKGKKLFVSHHVFHEDGFERNASDMIKKRPVYINTFRGEKAFEFGNLVGSQSSESNLYALSSSSSVIVDAVKNSAISLDQGVCAMYAEQEIAADISHSLDFKKGISLELYLSDPEKFGKQLGKGEVLEMNIIGKDNKGKIIYISNSPLAFPRSGLLEVQIKRALNSSKR